MNPTNLGLLASILFIFSFTACQAAPSRLPPATTIVSAFKQALTSAEDESVEEVVVTDAQPSEEHDSDESSITSTPIDLESSGVDDHGLQGKSGESSVLSDSSSSLVEEGSGESALKELKSSSQSDINAQEDSVELGSGDEDKKQVAHDAASENLLVESFEETKDKNEGSGDESNSSSEEEGDKVPGGSGSDSSSEQLDSHSTDTDLSVEEEKTKGDLKKNGQKDEPLKVQLDTDQLKKVKKGDKLQLQEKPDTGDSDDDDDSTYDGSDDDDDSYDSDSDDDSDDDDSDYDSDDDSDEDTTTNKTNQKDTEASVEKSINADTPKWPKSKEVKKEKKEN